MRALAIERLVVSLRTTREDLGRYCWPDNGRICRDRWLGFNLKMVRSDEMRILTMHPTRNKGCGRQHRCPASLRQKCDQYSLDELAAIGVDLAQRTIGDRKR